MKKNTKRKATQANLQTPPLAQKPRILDELIALMRQLGVVGEETILKLVYLVFTSSLLDRPLSMVLTGPSAAGKSFLIERVALCFPPTAYHDATALSPMALNHIGDRLVHKILWIEELPGLQSGKPTNMLRSLLTKGYIKYDTLRQSKRDWEWVELVVPGPTGLLATTTEWALDEELATRLMIVSVDASKAQTAAIMAALPSQRPIAADDTRLLPWLAFHKWVSQANYDVRIPYAAALEKNIKTIGVRQRRDGKALLRLVETIAIIHQASRRVSKTGRVVALMEDYSVAHALYTRVLSEQLGLAVTAEVRALVEVLEELCNSADAFAPGISVSLLAQKIGWTPNYTWRQVERAERLGYVRNKEERRSMPAKLVPGDPIPDAHDVLPTPEELRHLHREERRCKLRKGSRK